MECPKCGLGFDIVWKTEEQEEEVPPYEEHLKESSQNRRNKK